MICGIGIDITEVSRLRQAVNRWGDGFLSKVFTENELKVARQKVSIYQHLAGRFAAKEAVFKALGNPELGWHDVEISNDVDGKPMCTILNNKARGKKILISISHVKSYAVANAIVS